MAFELLSKNNSSITVKDKALKAWIHGLLIACCLLPLACAPEAEPQSNVQPPHPIYVSRHSSSQKNKGSLSLGDKGLPSSCQFVGESPTCIECQRDEVLLQRCFNYKGELLPEEHCVHTAEIIKCLRDKPPFAISVSWRSSSERYLIENFKAWQDMLLRIWQEKLDTEGLDELKKTAGLIEKMSQLFATQKLETLSSEEIDALFGEDMQPAPLNTIKAFLKNLQSKRVDGKLGFRLLLDETRAFLRKSGELSPAWKQIDTLNLEGFEN